MWVRSGASYEPVEEFYRDTSYAPRRANDLTQAHGSIIGQFIDGALERGLEVYLQVGATQPPGLRDEDRPRLPGGGLPQDRMADTGSLASPAIRSYLRAYVRDLLNAYPQITGLRPDWPEYPCYKLDEAFQDFGPQVRVWAGEHGFDFEPIRAAAGEQPGTRSLRAGECAAGFGCAGGVVASEGRALSGSAARVARGADGLWG